MTEITPIQYILHLEPSLETFKFKGFTEIKIQTSNPIEELKLNTAELEYQKIEIKFDNNYFELNDFNENRSSEELNIKLPKNDKTEMTIKFTYNGIHNDDLRGFYRSKFYQDGKEKYVLVSQFEANDARRAFPCFDIPGKKAIFDIEFLIEKDLSAISNMPIIEEKVIDSKKLIRFDKTPIMSTYLVFFAVGEFDFIEKMDNNIQYRVIAAPGKPQKYGKFSLDFGVKVVNFCEKYFDIPYPLPKLDQIATPDFAAGAMENWGAILYREDRLLHYNEETSKFQENRILDNIAHEISHQWFGNLVSPINWKYLWLNESFATFFSAIVVNHYYPEKRVFENFVLNTDPSRRTRSTSGVMDWDSMINTSPIEILANDLVAYTAKTIPILYEKGSSILRQVETYIGKDEFQKGLQIYFRKYKYGVTKSDNLWGALEESSGKPVIKMMESWVLQKGLPYITIQRQENTFTISQQRFTYLEDKSDQLWIIPISVKLIKDNKVVQTKVLELSEKSQKFNLGDFDYYKINIDLAGFYRVLYPLEDYEGLGYLIKNNLISSIDKMNIEDDLFAFVKAGKINLNFYLEFIKNYEQEKSHLSLFSISNHLQEIFNLVNEDDKKEKIGQIGKNFIDTVFDRIGYDPTTDEDVGISIIRGPLLGMAATLGSDKAKSVALEKLNLMKSGENINSDIRSSVLIIGASETNDYNWFKDQMENAENEAEYINYIKAMSSFSDKELLEKVLSSIFSEIPSRNREYAIAIISTNETIRKEIWHWFLANLDAVEALNNFMLQNVIVEVISNSYERRNEIIDFFDNYTKKNTNVRDAYEVGLEQLDIQMKFRKIINS